MFSFEVVIRYSVARNRLWKLHAETKKTSALKSDFPWREAEEKREHFPCLYCTTQKRS